MARFLRTALLSATLAAMLAGGAGAQQRTPRLDAIVNAASYRGELGEGSFATAYGEFPMASEACGPEYSPAPKPFPTELCGIRILADDAESPMSYASRGQINFFVPKKTGPVKFKVIVNGAQSQAIEKEIHQSALGFFRYGSDIYRNLGAITTNLGKVMDEHNMVATHVADDKLFMTLWATGGGMNPDLPVPPGTPTPAGPMLYPTPKPESIRIDGQQVPDADLLFAGHSPNFAGLWQYDLRLPRLATGAHTLEMTLQGRTDKIDFYVKGEEGPTLAGRIQPLKPAPETFGGMYNGRDLRTSPTGNFAVPNTPDGGEITIDKALTQKYPVTTIKVPAGASVVNRRIPTFIEHLTIRKDYDPYAPRDPSKLFEDQVFTDGNTPINSIQLLDFEGLQGNGEPNGLKWDRPIPIYFDPAFNQENKEHIMKACPTPWETPDLRLSYFTEQEPESGIIVREAGAGEGNIVTFDDSRPVEFTQRPFGTTISKGRMILKLVPFKDKDTLCVYWKHENGHAVPPLQRHFPGDRQFLMSVIPSPNSVTGPSAPAFELQIAQDYARLTADENPREFSWTRSTAPLDPQQMKQEPTVNSATYNFAAKSAARSAAAQEGERREVRRVWSLDDGSVARIVRHHQPAGSAESYFETVEVEGIRK